MSYNSGSNRNNPNRSGGGQTKMRIRAFQMTVGEPYISKVWDMLRNAIMEIQRKNNSGLSFEELYRNAYTMVLHKYGDKLYNGTKDAVKDHLLDTILGEVERAVETGDFLTVLNNVYKDHHTAMVMIRDILMYMDRVYVQQQGVSNVYNMGMEEFRDRITHHNNINTTITNTLLHMIARERLGEAIDRSAIKAACGMLVVLGGNHRLDVYQNDFEGPFLAQTSEFYRNESQTLIAENSASEYIHRVQERLYIESDRARLCFDKTTEDKVIHVLETELVERHIQTIVDMENSGMVHMLSENKIADLRLLYDLLIRVKLGNLGLKTMLDCMSKHLRNEGAKLTGKIIGDTDQASTSKAAAIGVVVNPVHYVEGLIKLKDQYDKYLKAAFHNDPAFKRCIQSDFEHFINGYNKSAEFMSLYIDDVFKNGQKDKNETDIDRELDRVMELFRYLEEKDLFERYYKSHLAKRLLQNKNISPEIEKLMIQKLKTECGCQFTSKLEGMFKDMQLSDMANSEWRDYAARSAFDRSPIELDVKVLTTGCWLTNNQAQVHLPHEMQRIWQQYTKFYVDKHTGRKIEILPALGSGEMTFYFYGQPAKKPKKDGDDSKDEEKSINAATSNGPPRRHIIQLSTQQMIVMHLFGDRDKMRTDEIKEATGMIEKDLHRVLKSLSMGKFRILLRRQQRERGSAEISDLDEFQYNEAFTCSLTRFKIPMVSAGEQSSAAGKAGQLADTDADAKQNREKVEEDRRYEIEAAIVRIMKTRKQLQHNSLVSEVTNMLSRRFPPNMTQIKQRIEALMEREYLKRDDKDPRLFHYVA